MISSDDLGQIEPMDIETRARQSQGMSSHAIYEMVTNAIAQRHPGGGVLVDMGCGAGNLWSYLRGKCDSEALLLSADRYIGVDAVRYDDFPPEVEFISHNLEAGKAPLADGFADVVCAVETIEHLENPRAFMRELVRLTKPGGLVIVTTPNQLSWLSKLNLLLKNQFNAFQEGPGLYPAHLTALLEIDLIRIATECGLTNIKIDFSNQGRIPLTSWHWPKSLGFRGRGFSDNIIAIGMIPK